jgi:hypothetical protein
MGRTDTQTAVAHKLNLILGSHKHVPGGAGDDEFERAYERDVKPFLSTLYQYPKIQAVLHYSGVLLHWIERFHPECLMLIENLAARKQVEILGGGFYEPMLHLIPLQDKIGQVELLTTYLRKQFGKRPLGCWLPALAWEQNMVSFLSACGMGYTFLDEDQFKLAGLDGKDLLFPCISEDQGRTMTIFPLSKTLKVEFTRKKVSQALAAMAEKTGSDGGAVSVFPEMIYPADGSRSPESALHDFFDELSRCESLVNFTTPGKFFRNLQGLKKAYFPNSLGASLFPEKNPSPPILPRQFLIDFPEANGIYSKMVFTHQLINQLRGDKSRKRTAREELWKAQGCDVFYPSGEYGIGCPPVRKAAYKALIGAERICRERGTFIPSLMNFDFDLDGIGEYLFQDTKINCYIRLQGASIFELDYLPRAWNYLDTFRSGGVRERRTAFTDRLIPLGCSPQNVLAGRLSGARLCGGEPYEAAELDRVHGKVRFCLPGRPGIPFGQIEIEKTYFLKKETLSVSYNLSNRGTAEIGVQLAPEIDLSFPGEGESFVRFFKIKSGVKDAPLVDELAQDVEGIKIQDLKNEVQIVLGSKKSFHICIVPVKNAGLYQSTCLMPLQELVIPPGETAAAEFTLKFSH